MTDNAPDLIDNEASEHKYFHQMLNMAEDDLDPYQYRLLAHYVRWSNLKKKKAEGYKLTAKRCQMSPKMVLKARQYLIDNGWIKYVPPTPEQANKGIGGVVVIVDRWADNIKRYSDTPGSQVDQGGVKPGSQVDQKKERSTGKKDTTSLDALADYEREEQKSISVANDATGSATINPPLPQTDKPKSGKAPDPWYDNILAVWKLHAGGNGDMRKFLQGNAVKKGWKEYNPPPGYTLTDAEEVCSFARWYRNTHQGGKQDLSMVAERGKLQSAIIEWVNAGRPIGDTSQYRNERLFT